MDKDRAHKANKYFNALLGTEDVKLALYMEGVYHRTKVSGHMLPQQGREYVELRNITFSCDRDYIIDVPEYDDLSDGTWYDSHRIRQGLHNTEGADECSPAGNRKGSLDPE